MIRNKILAVVMLVCVPLSAAFGRRASKDAEITEETTETEADTTIVHDEAIEEMETDVAIVPRMSVMNVPISAYVSMLEGRINKGITGVLYEDTNIEDDGLMVKAEKNGDFKFDLRGDTLKLRLPIKIWAAKRFDLGLMTTDQEVNAAIDVYLSSRFFLGEDWNIVTKTTLDNYEWTKKPALKVLGAEISVKTIADGIIKRYKKTIEEAIDECVSKNVDMRGTIADIVGSLGKPMPMEFAGTKAFVYFNPDSIACTPLTIEHGKITTTLQLQTRITVALEDSTMGLGAKELPKLRTIEATSDSFDAQMAATVPYAVIDTLAMQAFKGKEIQYGKKIITIDTLFFYAGDSALVIGTHISGALNGDIYMQGIPYFDKAETALRVRSADYSLKTRNIALKFVNLFVRRKLKEKIEEELKIPLNEEMWQVKNMVNDYLYDANPADGVKLNGRLAGLDIADVKVTKRGITILIDLNGKVKVMIE